MIIYGVSDGPFKYFHWAMLGLVAKARHMCVLADILHDGQEYAGMCGSRKKAAQHDQNRQYGDNTPFYKDYEVHIRVQVATRSFQLERKPKLSSSPPPQLF